MALAEVNPSASTITWPLSLKRRRKVGDDEISSLLRTIFEGGGQVQCEEVEDCFDVDVVLEAQDRGLIKWYRANWNCDHLITLKEPGYQVLGEEPPTPFWRGLQVRLAAWLNRTVAEAQS